MDEDASVAEAAISVLIVVFTALWIMVNPRGAPDKVRRFLRSFERARVCLLAKLIFSQYVIVCIAIFTSIYLRIDLSVLNRLRDFHVLMCVVQPIFL